jgi:uncharacterized protein (TIGR02246 family)
MDSDAVRVVTRIIANLEAGWNSADGEMFSKPFAEDADFVTIRGEQYRNREVIARGHQAIFNSIYKGSKIEFQVTDTRTVAPGVIVAHISSTLNAPSGPLAGIHKGLATIIVVQSANTWKIASFHNGLVISK